MESSCLNKTVFDEVRGIFVAQTPEEVVRQALLKRMMGELGFPKALLAVEKELKELPHLQNISHSLPNRRADILCFAKEIHPSYLFYPLLLVECKAEKIDSQAREQVLGYNHHVKAYFVAVASKDSFLFTSHDGQIELSFLPSYPELVKVIKDVNKF